MYITVHRSLTILVYSLLSETPEKEKITAWKIGSHWKCSRTALDEYIRRNSHI